MEIRRRCTAVPVSWLVFFAALAMAAGKGPQDVVRETTQQLVQELRRGCESGKNSMDDPEWMVALVDRILLPHVDFQRMSRWVMGKFWKRMDDGLRRQFMQEFRTLLVHTYTGAIEQAVHAEISYPPVREGRKPGRVVVPTEVRLPSGQVVPIHYYMHQASGDWLVYDVRIEGISLIASYRTDFAAQVEKQGSVRAMVEALAEKNRQHADWHASGEGRDTAGGC